MEPPIRLYHNPQCSRSREVLDYLREQRIEPEIIEYLKTPPTVAELQSLVKKLGVAPSSLVRYKDFQRLGLEATTESLRWLEMIAEHPVLLERPILVVGERARIGRPLEKILDILPKHS